MFGSGSGGRPRSWLDGGEERSVPPPTQVAQRRQQLVAVQPPAAVGIVAAEHLSRKRQVAATHCVGG